MGFIERDARRRNLIEARAPEIWDDLRAAIRTDIEDFRKRYNRARAIEFRIEEPDNGIESMWVHVEIATEEPTGQNRINLQFDRKAGKIIESLNPGRSFEFDCDVDEFGRKFLVHNGKRLTVAEVSEIACFYSWARVVMRPPAPRPSRALVH